MYYLPKSPNFTQHLFWGGVYPGRGVKPSPESEERAKSRAELRKKIEELQKAEQKAKPSSTNQNNQINTNMDDSNENSPNEDDSDDEDRNERGWTLATTAGRLWGCARNGKD